MTPVILTIAGSDSGAGAGIQADLKSIAANGGYGISAITSVTAQNTLGVRSVHHMPPEVLADQVDALFEDFPVAAAKTGMLADEERVRETARLLEKHRPPNLVVDPVMISKSGFPLLDPAAMDALRTAILPLATVVTPNVHETAHLSGIEVHGPRDAEEAGRRILDLGARAVLVKGGHFEEQRATDVLVERDGVTHFPGEYIDSRNTHGTGCTYSAAIATQLGAGRSLHEAIRLARRYITEAIRHGPDVGGGAGPTAHFFYHPQDGVPWERFAEATVGGSS